NFTNEVGVCNTIRFLKNLSGLWIIQELRRVWNEQDYGYSWHAMEHMALEAQPFEFFVDPSDDVFLAPGDMAVRIQEYCGRTGQARPETHAQILRAAYEGLALLYAHTYDTLEKLSGRTLNTLRIVGGGCKDTLLDQLAANATSRRVVTGPIEATATGNLIMQMLAMGDIQSLEEGREIIRNSFAEETREFMPEDSEAWKSALKKWREICRAG
ncbi:MAG: rhamnulokinase, partial [Verrucomicrobia bacterium]|nr:rhamnulokinase [Verrucomicrobiota bacterium]